MRLFRAQRDPRPAVFAPRSDLLPQLADLHEDQRCRRRSFRCFIMRCGRAAVCSSACRKTSRGIMNCSSRSIRRAASSSAATWSPSTALPLRSSLPSAGGNRPSRGTARQSLGQRLRPAAQDGQHHHRAFRPDLCDRRRVRRGAVFLGRHRKISAGGGRPADPRHDRHGAAGFARRFARGAAPGQGIRLEG